LICILAKQLKDTSKRGKLKKNSFFAGHGSIGGAILTDEKRFVAFFARTVAALEWCGPFVQLNFNA